MSQSFCIKHDADHFKAYETTAYTSCEAGYVNPQIAVSYAKAAAQALIDEYGKDKTFEFWWLDGSTHLLGWLTYAELVNMHGVDAEFTDARIRKWWSDDTETEYGMKGKRLDNEVNDDFIYAMADGGEIDTSSRGSRLIVVCEDTICSGRSTKQMVVDQHQMVDVCITLNASLESHGWCQACKRVIKLIGSGQGEYKTCSTDWESLTKEMCDV